MKRFAVIVSGWHFPKEFYKQIKEQKIPEGWDVDYFCVSHRDPSDAIKEKRDIISQIGDGILEDLDRKLYDEVPTVEWLEENGWIYTLEPNNCGDWAVANQWLEKHPHYRNYELLLITHDDNFLLGDGLFLNVLDNRFDTLFRNDYSLNDLPEFKDAKSGDYSEVKADEDWLLLSNAIVNYTGKPRASFDFFKTSLIEKIGGSFDMTRVELDRTGLTDNMGMEYYGKSVPDGGLSMKDCEKPIQDFYGFMHRNNLLDTIRYLSPVYRISPYCLEGERGLLCNMATPQGKLYESMVGQYVKAGVLDV